VNKRDWKQIAIMFGVVYGIFYVFKDVIDDYIGVSVPAPGYIVILLLVFALIVLIYKVLGKDGWSFSGKEIAMIVFVGALIISTMIILPMTYPQIFSVKAIPEMQQAVITTAQSVMGVLGIG